MAFNKRRSRGALRPRQVENQPTAGLAGFLCGQSLLMTIAIFPSKTAQVEDESIGQRSGQNFPAPKTDPAKGPAPAGGSPKKNVKLASFLALRLANGAC